MKTFGGAQISESFPLTPAGGKSTTYADRAVPPFINPKSYYSNLIPTIDKKAMKINENEV